jgi:hypothetical protein
MSTYTPIASQTLSSSAAEVVFSGIPQTYTDLVLVMSARASSTNAATIYIQVNGDTASNYSATLLQGDGSSATSSRASSQTFMYIAPIQVTSGSFQPSITHFMNYSNTTTNKTVLTRANDSASVVRAYVNLWRSTAAINSIKIYPSVNSLDTGSTFTLYGIGAGSPKAFGGDIVTTDGTYWYHAYLSSGRFDPVQNLSCDVLTIAGGGGGGWNIGGGGGAGGLVYSASQSIAGAQVITIGAGGAAGIFNVSEATIGGNSIFGSITATGGGKGGSSSGTQSVREGGNGGSGGGASGYGVASGTNVLTNGGSASPSGQGFAGGGAYGNNQAPFGFGNAGGGGGAGVVGGTGSNGGVWQGGNGGNGVSTYSSWGAATSTGENISGTRWYAGGGGGASLSTGTRPIGGDGGGGDGGRDGNETPTAGTVNTGGGGGGSRGNNGNGTNGGSGIVIVRYAV